MKNKGNSVVRVCEIVDGVLSIILGVCCLISLGVFGRYTFPAEYEVLIVVASILVLCMSVYNVWMGCYIISKGCADHKAVAVVKIVVSAVLFCLSLFGVTTSVATMIFYLVIFLIDIILLAAVPYYYSDKKEETGTNGNIKVDTTEFKFPSAVQKYMKCPICNIAFIKEGEECCEWCRLEYKRMRATAELRVVSAKGKYDGKEGYKLMDKKWRNVGIVELNNPESNMIEPIFFGSLVSDYDRFSKKLKLEYSENQAKFEKKIICNDVVKIELPLDTTPRDETTRAGQPGVAVQVSSEDGSGVKTVEEDTVHDDVRQPVVGTMFGLGDEGMKQEFRKFLEEHGYAATTINAYVSAINKVAGYEHTDWEGVYKNIQAIKCNYDSYGIKAELGAQGHNTVISAIKKFYEFRFLK